jgi:hypothetical protein
MQNQRSWRGIGSFWLWTIALGVVFIASRVLFLDRDVPRYDFTAIQPIDELFYTIPAFNLFHYGGMAHSVVAYIPSDGSAANLLENVMTALTLFVFGNDYYGLRMASVLAALGVALLLVAMIRRETGSQLVAALALVYLVCDFSFNVAARVAEPTIFRMLALVAVLFVAFVWRPDGASWVARAVVMGFLAIAALVFVYTYNAFVVPAVFLMLLLEAWPLGLRRIVINVGAGVVGAALAMLAFAAATFAGWGESPLDVYLKDIAPFGARLSFQDMAAAIPVNLNEILFTNFFRFDPVLLVLVALALPAFVHRVLSQRRSFDVLLATTLVMLIVQTAVASDYPERKLLIFQPLALLVIAVGAFNVGPFRAWLGTSGGARIAAYVYAAAMAWLVLRVYVGPLPLLGARYEALILACSALLVAALALRWWRGERWRGIAAAALALAVAIPGVVLSAQQLFVNPTFRYRDAMIAAAPLIDGKVTAGVYAYGFRLYNTSRPTLNPYQYQYSDSSLATYNGDLKRLVDEGAFGATVSDPDNASLNALGLVEAARYFIEVEGHKSVVVYTTR